MNRNQFRRVWLFTVAVFFVASPTVIAAPATGPLRVSDVNPRYFTDGSGKAIYLTGAHTWNNLVDMGRSDPPEAFDFDVSLNFLERHHHNFIRLWAWDSVTWDTKANGNLGKDFVHRAEISGSAPLRGRFTLKCPAMQLFYLACCSGIVGW
jgi:hypothetical protein